MNGERVDCGGRTKRQRALQCSGLSGWDVGEQMQERTRDLCQTGERKRHLYLGATRPDDIHVRGSVTRP